MKRHPNMAAEIHILRTWYTQTVLIDICRDYEMAGTHIIRWKRWLQWPTCPPLNHNLKEYQCKAVTQFHYIFLLRTKCLDRYDFPENKRLLLVGLIHFLTVENDEKVCLLFFFFFRVRWVLNQKYLRTKIYI